MTLKGELVDAAVKVFPEGETKEITAGRTYSASTTNPRLFMLPSGAYKMEVHAITLDGNPIQKMTELTLIPGDTLTKEVDFTNGTVKVKVTRNGDLSDATVKIFKTGERKEVAAHRSYKHDKSNPVTFDVLPGLYDVEIKGIEIAGDPVVRFENQMLNGGDALSFEHNFLSGELKIGAKKGADLVDAVVTIHHKDSGKEADRGRTYMHDKSNPKAFTLEPGTYKVEVKAIKPQGLGAKTMEVNVAQGGSVEVWGEF